MTLLSAVNPTPVDPDAWSPHDALPPQPTGPPDAEAPELEGARPRGSGRGRRIAVAALSLILVGTALVTISLAFAQGSWWYTYEADQALDHATRAQIEAIRDQVDASALAPEALRWLNAALFAPHPTDVRNHLITAREILRATDDPDMVQAAEELGAILGRIRSAPLWEPTSSPPLPALERPLLPVIRQ
jgi:hypothetical protein